MTFHIMGCGPRSMRISPNAQSTFKTLKNYLRYLKEEVIDDDIKVISGLAEGWDEAIAKAAIGLEIPFLAMVPHPTFGEYYWGRASVTGRNRLSEFQELLAQAESFEIVCQDLYENGTHANFIRNSAMINISDMALAQDLGTKGTRDAIAKLKAVRKPIHFYPFIKQGVLFA